MRFVKLMVVAFLLVGISAVTAQETVEVPKDALDEMALLVGEWEAEGTINGEPFKGTYTAKWVPGKYCLILTSKLTGSAASQASGIGGWSPRRKQYVETWYTSDGTTRTIRYSLGKQKGVWTGKLTDESKDGKKGSAKTHLRASENEFSGGSSGTSDGEKVEVNYTCRRK